MLYTEGNARMSEFQQENRRRTRRYAIVFACLFFVLLLIFYANVSTGTVALRGDTVSQTILWRIRLPRVCLAMILGGALALSGFLLQTFFENPIAGPYILGISSGAKLTVTLSMLLTLTQLRTTSAAINVVAAFIGALLSTGFILLISKRVQHMASILIGGIMIGYVASAITDFLITFAEDADIVNLHGWSLGSFSGADWQDVRVSLAVVGVTMALIFAMSKQIGAFRLGEGYARSLGVDVRRFRTILILLSSILSATVTAFAGPISFVGVAAPYIMRRLLRTSEPRVLIPAAFLGGAAFTAACDLLARTLLSPTELNISTVTSLIGAPVVIWMLLQERRR